MLTKKATRPEGLANCRESSVDGTTQELMAVCSRVYTALMAGNDTKMLGAKLI
jgi:hypothetical protein